MFVVFRNILFYCLFQERFNLFWIFWGIFIFVIFLYMGISPVIWNPCCCRLTFFYCFTFTSERFRVSNLIKQVTLRIKVKKKYSEWIWRFEAREGKKVKNVFANTTAQRGKKLNPHANTPAAVKWTKLILNIKIHEKYTGY